MCIVIVYTERFYNPYGDGGGGVDLIDCMVVLHVSTVSPISLDSTMLPCFVTKVQIDTIMSLVSQE